MLKRFTVLILAVALLLGICATAVVVRCDQLKSPPQAPVYPASTLSRQRVSRLGGDWSGADYYYTSTDAPEKIVAFYTEKGSCGEGERVSGRESCHGNAVSFGEYLVYVDLGSYASQGMTSYNIGVLWRGCSTSLD